MTEILITILLIGAILILGLICFFLLILSDYKDEIWEKIKNDR